MSCGGSSPGEAGWTARLVPLTVDGLIYASSMVMLDSARRKTPVPALARWLLLIRNPIQDVRIVRQILATQVIRVHWLSG